MLSAAAYPAVSNARATGDYFHAADQWAVGATSLFYWALGILPFKDGFYSSSNKQVGGQTVGPEKNPDREALMATLSCAMVGPMDGINLLNKSRTMTTCRADGTVLKPDRPVATADYCFTAAARSSMDLGGAGAGACYIYSTITDLEGCGPIKYFYQDRPQTVTMAMAGMGHGALTVYNWYTGTVQALGPPAGGASVDVAAGYEGHVYAIITPVLTSGWSFIGEVDKYVTASALRFSNFMDAGHGGGGLKVDVTGVANESVKVCASVGSTLNCKTVAFTAAGVKTVAFCFVFSREGLSGQQMGPSLADQ